METANNTCSTCHTNPCICKTGTNVNAKDLGSKLLREFTLGEKLTGVRERRTGEDFMSEEEHIKWMRDAKILVVGAEIRNLINHMDDLMKDTEIDEQIYFANRAIDHLMDALFNMKEAINYKN